MINAKVVEDENGNRTLQGQKNGVIYLSPSLNSNGMLKIELDNELIQGANITIDYIISVENRSEKDFVSRDFYTYGIQAGEEVQITPVGVYDYLDNELAATQVNGWIIKSKEEYSTEVGPLTITEFRNKVSSIETSTETETNENGTSITTNTSYMERERNYYEMEQSRLETWYSEVQETRQEKMSDKIILYNAELTKPLKAGEKNEVSLQTSKILTNSDEIDLNNEAEITNITRNGGSTPNVIRDRYVVENLNLWHKAETVTITTPTGENRDYAMMISIGISTLAILGAGIILIKKKILQK